MLCACEVGQSANIGFELHLKSLPREFDRQYTGKIEPMADPHFELGVGGGGGFEFSCPAGFSPFYTFLILSKIRGTQPSPISATDFRKRFIRRVCCT